MSADTATLVHERAPAAQVERPASEWRTVRVLARVEARRLLKVTGIPAALAVLMVPGSGGDLVDLRSYSFNAAFNVLLLAAVTLVASHRAVTRGRRDGTEEVLRATPAAVRARTVGHLLAVAGPVTLGAVVVAVSVVVMMTGTATVGDPVLAELAVGPMLVAGAGCLGVLLARTWPQPVTPYLACLAIAASELVLNTPRFAGSGARWLTFWIEGSLWWLVPRHSVVHLVYLMGLVAMAIVGALARHGLTRRVVVAGAAAVAATVLAAGLQMRQPREQWRAANSVFAAPESVQRCWSESGVRYCAFPRFEEVMQHVSGLVAAVRAVTPEPAWPSGLALAQRVTALDLQYVDAAADQLPHVPDMPRSLVRQPDDGGIHPGLEFGWSIVQELGLGVQLGARTVGLPVVPDPGSGEVCLAAGQARVVVALWLGAHASDDAADGLAWLVDRAQEGAAANGRAVDDAVFPIADQDVYGGFAISADDARLALAMLGRDDAAIEEVLVEHWNVLTDPTTAVTRLAEMTGLPVAAGGPPRAPFVAHVDAGHAAAPGRHLVRLGARCS